ncbi:MAG TPA: thioredoxin domain-containing protein [Candidatus Angelobacter sp.]
MFKLKITRDAVLCLAVLWLLLSPAMAQSSGRTVSQNQSATGYAELANNPAAPVKILEFFDYQCPFCAATIPALEEALRSYPGKIQFILKNTPLAIHPDSMLAHQAALAAGEQGKFWEMHALLFQNQKKLKLADLLQYARQLNLDVARFQDRLQSGYYKAAVEEDRVLAEALGVLGTPTFFINGHRLEGRQTVERFKRTIDVALNPASVRAAASTAQPVAAVGELDLSYSPVRGKKDAPVTIIEFSDMQCPFCARVSPTLRELMTQYPDQIRWVFKNFPLSFHHDSELAHRAVLAAGEQGKFWEMHDLVFADQPNIRREDLFQKARSLDLDIARFTADLNSDKLKHNVEADRAEGIRLGVSGTPTFFVNGKRYSGTMPLVQFRGIVDDALASAGTNAAATANADKADEVTMGNANASVTLTWFSDLQSDLTLRATLQIRELMRSHPGKIKVIFRNRPLETHSGAMRLHEAALAANAQGKFWQMHDLIVANPQRDDKETLLSYASRIGLDLNRFQKDLENDKYRLVIERDLDEAKRRAVQGTPVLFINSVRVDGLQSQKTIEDILAKELTGTLRANSADLVH